MEKFKPHPMNVLRTALAASLPLAAGLSACGGNTNHTENQPIPYATATPTQESPKSFITCPPTNPNTPKDYERIINETVAQHGGAVILTIHGLVCNNNNRPLELSLGMRSISGSDKIANPSNTQESFYGYSDGSSITKIIPATDCNEEYLLGSVITNPTIPSPTVDVDFLQIPDSSTGKRSYYFKLDENCTKTIEFGKKPNSAN